MSLELKHFSYRTSSFSNKLLLLVSYYRFYRSSFNIKINLLCFYKFHQFLSLSRFVELLVILSVLNGNERSLKNNEKGKIIFFQKLNQKIVKFFYINFLTINKFLTLPQQQNYIECFNRQTWRELFMFFRLNNLLLSHYVAIIATISILFSSLLFPSSMACN